jgi:chromosome segregation ATPase
LWNCHFDESHCVKDVPVGIVIEELRRIIAGSGGFRTIALEPDTTRLKELGLEAATVARARLRRLNGELVPLRAAMEATRAENNGLQETVRDLQDQLQHRSSEVTEVGERLRQANEQLRLANEQPRQAN